MTPEYMSYKIAKEIRDDLYTKQAMMYQGEKVDFAHFLQSVRYGCDAIDWLLTKVTHSELDQDVDK